jgi:hypothetical protein
MQILLSDPKTLPQPQSDRLAEFLNSDTCKTLRTVVRSHIANALLKVGEVTTSNAEEFLRSGAINMEAQQRIGEISRYSIFLSVLDEVQNDLKTKSALVITEKLTVDTN